MKKKLVALLVTGVMVASMIPAVSAYADSDTSRFGVCRQ